MNICDSNAFYQNIYNEVSQANDRLLDIAIDYGLTGYDHSREELLSIGRLTPVVRDQVPLEAKRRVLREFGFAQKKVRAIKRQIR